jgi:hypothetical protein
MSLIELRNYINNAITNAELNKVDPFDIPVFVKYDGRDHVIGSVSLCVGSGVKYNITTSHRDELVFTAPDSKPEVGEYWRSRGPSIYDCSGFIVSKLAGERLLRMVRYVLDTDNPKSWLDFREYDPNWIQFKFKSEEFNLDLLDKMSRDAGGIITEDILRKCKK